MDILLYILFFIIIFFLLYILLIMPRLAGRPDYTQIQGHLYAHRGLHDNNLDAPENSLAAFGKAVDAGYGIELDVQLSKDGEVVVFHDDLLKRVARKINTDGSREEVQGRVRDYTLAELKEFRLLNSDEQIPTFDEFLALADGKVPLVVEIKEETLNLDVCPKVQAKLSAYKGAYCIESFNPFVVFWYRRKHKNIIRGQLSDVFYKSNPEEFSKFKYFVLAHLLFNFLAKPDFIAYNHHYHEELSRMLCKKLYRGLAVAWTIKSEDELNAAARYFDLFIFDSFVPSDETRKRFEILH